jgi:transcriptional regulator of acetoin/glycerol metabolism
MLRQAEQMALRAALDKAQGNKSTAARILGIGRATLYAKLREAGLLREGKRGRPRKSHESTQSP